MSEASASRLYTPRLCKHYKYTPDQVRVVCGVVCIPNYRTWGCTIGGNMVK